MNRSKRLAALTAVLLACASRPAQQPQSCAAETDCAADAHCSDGVCVADAAPQALIAGPRAAKASTDVVFDGSGSNDADDAIVAYIWSVRVRSSDCAPELGPGDGVTFGARFGCPGEFDVILVVRDGTGVMSDPAIMPVTVTAP